MSEKSKEWYKLQVRDLTKALDVSNKKLAAVNLLLRANDQGECDELIDEITNKSSFTKEDLKEMTADQLLTISISVDKSNVGYKGINPSNDAVKKPSGLTVGAYNADTGKFEV